MTKEEVLRKINEALEALQSYRSEYQGQQQTDTYEKIKDQSKKLLKEAFELGASGKPCPTCGGSGRV